MFFQPPSLPLLSATFRRNPRRCRIVQDGRESVPATANLYHPPMTPLAPAVRSVWRIKLALTWTVLVLVAAGYDVFTWISGSERLVAPGVLTGLVLVVGVVVCAVVPGLRYRAWRYDLLAHELYLERGILNRVRTIVPLRRIQHLDVSQDIVEREFELGKLIVHTAGTRSSDVVLPGLRIEEAEILRDRVKRYILEDADSPL